MSALRRTLLGSFVLLVACSLPVRAQINFDVAEVEIIVNYQGSPLSQLGLACELRGSIDGNWTGANHCYGSAVRSVAAGDHAFQLMTNYGYPLGPAVSFTAVAGQRTTVVVDAT